MTNKIPYVEKKLFDYFLEKNVEKPKTILTKSRNSTILPTMLGYKIGIYNGKVFKYRQIHKNLIGIKLGQLTQTRKRHVYKTKKK